jgi:hypothetical protein
MGTNFYIETCDADGFTDMVHIGKRSGGWVFSFQGGIYASIDAWQKRLDETVTSNGENIQDEYGTVYTVQEFWEMVEETKLFRGLPAMVHSKCYPDKTWTDQGYSFSGYEFF